MNETINTVNETRFKKNLKFMLKFAKQQNYGKLLNPLHWKMNMIFLKSILSCKTLLLNIIKKTLNNSSRETLVGNKYKMINTVKNYSPNIEKNLPFMKH